MEFIAKIKCRKQFSHFMQKRYYRAVSLAQCNLAKLKWFDDINLNKCCTANGPEQKHGIGVTDMRMAIKS